jgi:DNA-binding MarR family transcriptional regulator
MSIIDDSGVLAIATRLVRLSDQLRKDGALVYKEFGIEFEPKWFPVIYVLYHKQQLSVVELAQEIGYSHPSTISLLKELEKQRLVRGQKDKTDQRKRLIRLTEQGRALVTSMEPVWQTFREAFAGLLDTNNNLMLAIIEVENNFREKSLLQRALECKH